MSVVMEIKKYQIASVIRANTKAIALIFKALLKGEKSLGAQVKNKGKKLEIES